MSNEAQQAQPIDAIRFRLIKDRMAFRRITFASVAKRLGVTRATVTLVAQGGRVSKRVQTALARACQLREKELWG